MSSPHVYGGLFSLWPEPYALSFDSHDNHRELYDYSIEEPWKHKFGGVTDVHRVTAANGKSGPAQLQGP